MFPSGYSSRQFTQDRISSSSASNSRPQQTPQGGASGYSTRGDYFRNTAEYESELGHLLLPPSPPPSLDQILSVRPGNSSSPRPTPTPSPNSSHQSLYNDLERELLEPSSSHQQPDANSNSRYHSLYDDFAQALSAAPDSSHSSSRRQSAAYQLTFEASQGVYSRYPGVYYNNSKGRWIVRWKDSTINRRVSLGSYSTRSEAIRALENYKASRPLLTPNRPGVYYVSATRNWEAKYYIQGERVNLGRFSTQEEAERALQEHREARGLPPMSARRN